MKYRRVASTLGFVLLILLVIPFLIYAVPMTVGGDQSFVVLSGSMEPELSPGDVVIVQETPPETIEEGDVVTFVEPGSDGGVPVTHRVIGIEERSEGADGTGSESIVFETQGDANSNPDSEPVDGENVIGTVLLTIPFIGYVTQFASTPLGFVLLVGLPVGLLFGSEIWRLLRAAEDGSEAGSASKPDSSPDSSSGSDPKSTTTPTQPAAPNETSATEMTITLTDLTVTLGMLALLMPYAIYTAFQLQTALSLTVAFATVFLTLGLGTLRVFARPDRSAAQTAADASSEVPAGSDHPSDEERYFGFWNESFAWGERGDSSSGSDDNENSDGNSKPSNPESESAHTFRETDKQRSPSPPEESGA